MTARVQRDASGRALNSSQEHLRDHALFIAYAPAEAPRIAVAVLVEHMGHGGSAAAPLAKQLIEEFVKLRPLDPIVADPEPPASDSARRGAREGTS